MLPDWRSPTDVFKCLSWFLFGVSLTLFAVWIAILT